MSSIIEQAARRLEELKRSGIEVPRPVGAPPEPAGVRVASSNPVPGPVASVRELPPVQRLAPAGPGSKTVQIDLARLAEMGYLTPSFPRGQTADEFRVIKRPLLKNVASAKSANPVSRANLIMVTSSVPGEGKTFVSCNLAMSLAMELDTTVLLVDADVSRASVLSRLGLMPSQGLLDVLTNPSLPLSSVMLRTNVEKLAILPAGTPNGRATELLASEAMNRLLDEMAERYADRLVVFDAPPLLASTESRVLASHMGQIVMVVEADRTPQKVVSQAMATIETCPVVFPLLNKISRSEVGSYYGYYEPIDG